MTLPEGVALQRCFLHSSREAAARCPGCLRFFCRECVTEHDDRVICNSCLRLQTAAAQKPPPRKRAWFSAAAPPAGLLLLWLLIYSVGWFFSAMPNSVHAISFWSEND